MLDINSVFTEGFIEINKSYIMQLDNSFIRHGVHLQYWCPGFLALFTGLQFHKKIFFFQYMQGEFHIEHGIHRFEVGRQSYAVC